MKLKKDNSTFPLKLSLRRQALLELDAPVVMEAHGGWGKLYGNCYSSYPGVVFERKPDKAAYLAQQRPTWAVYEANCDKAIREGAGNHLPVNFLDLDPYGEPWPVMSAFLEGKRVLPAKLVIVVNDGLRKSLKMGTGWRAKSLEGICQKYGNQFLYDNYLGVCKEMVNDRAEKAGYDLTKWTAYFCGHLDTMSHYAAVLEIKAAGNGKKTVH